MNSDKKTQIFKHFARQCLQKEEGKKLSNNKVINDFYRKSNLQYGRSTFKEKITFSVASEISYVF